MDKQYIHGIAHWHTVKKGDSVQATGKPWHWSPHCRKNGVYDGVYTLQKLSDHLFKGSQQGTTPTAYANITAVPTPASKLDTSRKLQDVPYTNVGMCEEDVEKIFDQASN